MKKKVGRPANPPGVTFRVRDVPKKDLARFRKACRDAVPKITMRAAFLKFVKEFEP